MTEGFHIDLVTGPLGDIATKLLFINLYSRIEIKIKLNEVLVVRVANDPRPGRTVVARTCGQKCTNFHDAQGWN